MRLFRFGLHMDGDLGARLHGADGVLQPVADVMRLPDGHGRRHDEVEIDEGRRAGPARLQVVHAERAGPVRRDGRLDRLGLPGSTAWSIRPSTEWAMTFQPW